MALLQIGPLVARTFGFTRTLFIWVVSGVCAILLPALLMPTGLTIGASGSVFGLIGVAMVFGHRVGTPQGIFIRNKMIEWTIFCTLFGLMMGGVAHSAHFGGLIGGGLLSFVLAPPTQQTKLINSFLMLGSALVFILWSLWSAWDIYQQVSIFG
jgi:rhomboid protease GluP